MKWFKVLHTHKAHFTIEFIASTGDSLVNLAHARLVAQFKRNFKVALYLQHYSELQKLFEGHS